MNLNDLIKRTRTYVRDENGSLFSQDDISSWINEAIDRVREIIYPLNGMTWLRGNSDEPILMPEEWHYLLALYSASRCSTQDEQEYRANSFMSEFEMKLQELNDRINSGAIIIVDENGNPIPLRPNQDIIETVKNVYFRRYWKGEEGADY